MTATQRKVLLVVGLLMQVLAVVLAQHLFSMKDAGIEDALTASFIGLACFTGAAI